MTQIELANVSRETLESLQGFSALVQKWTQKINLISRSSTPYIWDRHIADSLQLVDLTSDVDHWVDMGSGGGFPGIVVALVAKGRGDRTRFTLIESDQRKCVFLRTAVREFSLNVNVINDRIEAVPPLMADVLSARALTDLDGLLRYADHHLSPDGAAFFPKGENWKAEDAKARNNWAYLVEPIQSLTDPSAAILKIKEISHV